MSKMAPAVEKHHNAAVDFFNSRGRGNRAVKAHNAAKKVFAYVILDHDREHVGNVHCVSNPDSGLTVVDVFYMGKLIWQGKSHHPNYESALAGALDGCVFDEIKLHAVNGSGLTISQMEGHINDIGISREDASAFVKKLGFAYCPTYADKIIFAPGLSRLEAYGYTVIQAI